MRLLGSLTAAGLCVCGLPGGSSSSSSSCCCYSPGYSHPWPQQPERVNNDNKAGSSFSSPPHHIRVGYCAAASITSAGTSCASNSGSSVHVAPCCGGERPHPTPPRHIQPPVNLGSRGGNRDYMLRGAHSVRGPQASPRLACRGHAAASQASCCWPALGEQMHSVLRCCCSLAMADGKG